MFQVKMILDSVSPDGHRLTTIAATYPRYVHSEVLTHRDRARNAASSRAIPWRREKDGKLIENCMYQMILSDPVIPIHWGAEQKGMQAGDEIEDKAEAERIWLEARDNALASADALANLGVHKSLCNRLTEPFMFITTLMTATSWKNFFRLRCHPDAEKSFQRIAGMIRDLMADSIPNRLTYGDWHLPYIRPDDYELLQADILADSPNDQLDAMEREAMIGKLKKISAGRCARLSYLTHEGRRDPQADIDLCDRLINRTDDVLHACYDSETEVLTTEGWKAWPKVTGREQFCTLNLRSQEIEYQAATAAHLNLDYSGEMCKIQNAYMDVLVTPNHYMLVCPTTTVRGRKKLDYKLIQARELLNLSHAHMKGGQKPYECENLFSHDLMALYGFALGDGHRPERGHKLTFHLRKQRKIEYLRSLVPDIQEQSGDTFVMEYPFDFDIYDGKGVKYLDPALIMSTDAYAIFEGLMNSDGSESKTTKRFSTTSQSLADGFMQLCVHLGFGFSASKQGELTNINVVEDWIKPEINKYIGSDTKMEVVQHSGKVFCVTVPNGTLYIRRNGIGMWCGNSPLEHVAQCHSRDHRSGPYRGWKQFRKEFINECADD